jgi:hypothetical protein
MAAPDLDRKEIQNFFQAVTSTIPSADSVTETAARSENRKAMLREASNALDPVERCSHVSAAWIFP